MGQKRKQGLILAVTADTLELPLYVADTIEEMSEIVGYSKYTICHSISLNRKRMRDGKPPVGVDRKKSVRFYRVLDDEEDYET